MKVWLPTIDHLGGLLRFCEYLAEGLTAAGHDVTVTPFPLKDHYFPWALQRLQAPAGVDIVLANSWSAFGLRRPGARLVVYDQLAIHDASYRPYRSRTQALFHATVLRRHIRASLRAADAVVAVSQFVADSLARTFGGPSIDVIHNGIDTGLFCPKADGKLPLDGRPARLLFAGDLIRRKGADLLRPMLAALGPGFELLCIGSGRSKVNLPTGAAVTIRERLSPTEMRDAYQWADLLVYPSRLEGFGFAAAEALACATPAVAAATSALPEVVSDGATGLLCRPNDAVALAAAVRELTGDPARLTVMGRNARDDVVARFDRTIMVGRYLALFERLGLR